MGLHFILEGAELASRASSRPCRRTPPSSRASRAGFSWSLDGPVELLYRSPVDIYIDEWIYELLEAVERLGARRVLIDSLADLQFAAGDDARFREFMYSLTQRFSRAGVSLFMTSELPDLFGVTRLSDYGVSHLSDNVLLLQYLRDGSSVRRALTVLKTRATRNARRGARVHDRHRRHRARRHDRQPAVDGGELRKRGGGRAGPRRATFSV